MLMRKDRFVSMPREVIEKQLSSENGKIRSEISGLEKKLHYHETTNKNSRENMEHIFRSTVRT